MRNKGLVISLTIIVTLLCVYYLSFTLVTKGIQQEATEYARDETGSVNFNKRQEYLDSIWNKPVYDLFGAEFTYREIKETELSLGLDLQGGMHVTLEVSPVDIIKGLSGNSKDPDFLAALEDAKKAQRNSQASFTSLFYDAFKERKPNSGLGEIFANAANRGRISFNTPDNEILDVINKEVEDAIDRSFQILRTRIDRFGTSQPNIQRLQGTGRIQIELPGVENKERVRKLLQGVAKLEFWEVWSLQEIGGSLQSVNDMLVAEEQAKGGVTGLDDALSGDSDLSSLTEEDDLSDLTSEDGLSDLDGLESDSSDALADLAEDTSAGSLDSLEAQVPQISPIISQYGPFYYPVEDTAAINDIFSRDDVKALMPSNVQLSWTAKANKLDDGTELMELVPLRKLRTGKAPIEGDVITNARQDFDERGQPAVYMNMNSQGAKKWRKMTSENIDRRIAIVLDGFVFSAPNVSVEIPDGSSIISGSFTIEEAKDLANILKAGALPAPTRIVEEAVIGPSLGKVAQQQGIVSILAGLGIVVVFMIAYYSKGGLVANLALAFNVFFILGILAQLNAALTLPGIAGIVLTIGMSIDANVLIFERIREELRNSAGLKAAINAGYQKAFSSIVDANATTLLTAAILYVLGQGPVKGFAITLIIGIFCSFFSAVFITRVIVEWMSKKGDDAKISFATPLSKGLLSKLEFNFMSKRKFAYIFSGIFIVVGIVAMSINGLNLGVDFKGGRSFVVTFDETVVPSKLETSLSSSFDNQGTEVKTYGASNVVKITTAYLVDDESTDADEKVEQALINGISESTGLTFNRDDSQVDATSFTISSSSKVGATIADDIKNSSYQSAIFGILVIFVYIVLRFRKWQFGLGAVIALVHDTLFVLSAFAISGLLGIKSFEIDQVFIAAVLTIIGYSINDTVIVFDRIRETTRLFAKDSIFDTFNVSINNTLNRTLITSVTTLVVVLVLFIFGGEVLRGFSFALLIGILVGTYSSIFIATPTVLDLSKKGS
ncbi:MAG: protein translocase subunit SecDF [Bacteroidota bacterium]